MNLREVNVVELGTTYKLDKYRVVSGVGIQRLQDIIEPVYEDLAPEFNEVEEECFEHITFVRGDIVDDGMIIPRVDGILHEQLLSVMIKDLEYKSKLVPSEETQQVILKLKEARMWLGERQLDRQARGVQGTYNK